ncbi:MAG: SDR family NAD(P)-dependent oxidoreductase [Chitinivibrionales bacterium]|nr:SDR family NAD(P)-dependent oxidoreductase [Chitinivibrionales bacterium]MBD3394053.1 SDR family NAD(P)-dependent oxidoreductase [Chitinivibrionales bacterium]
MSWLNLDGKTAVVTGGALGIGRAICDGFAECGAHVVVADVNFEGATQTVTELTSRFGGEHRAVNANVTSRQSVDDMIATAVDAFGRLDVLVNNAGINIPRLLMDPAGKEELTEDIWDKVVAVNQKGLFLCAQAAARQMVSSGAGGVIINVASESGMEGSEGQSVYAGTKAAAYTLTRSWAKELGRHGVRVVGVAPGILEATGLRSPEYERALAYTRGITVEQLRAGYEKVSIPLGRSGRLSEVADTVCFLASERAGYIHGTTVNISGGKTRV